MYKKVKKYVQEKGLTVAERNGLAYGNFGGVFLAIHQDPTTPARHTVQIWVKPGPSSTLPDISGYLNQCTSKFKYLQSATYGNGRITAEFQGLGFQWGKNYVPCLDDFLKEISEYCANSGLTLSCEQCETPYDLSLYQADGVSHVLCPSCYANVADRIRQNVNRKAKEGSGNVIGGIVGAFLGSLLGVILWVLIYQLGYISAIAGAVMVICALKGYEMLGGKLNTKGIVISCIISVLMVLVAEQTSLSIEIYNAYIDYYDITFFDAFRSAPSFLEEPDIKAAVIGDLAIGYILMAVGAWGTVRQALKAGSGRQDFQKIAPVSSVRANIE